MAGIGGGFWALRISADMAGFSAIIQYHGATSGRYGGILALLHRQQC